MILNKQILLGAATTFFGLLFISEIILRTAVPSRPWQEYFNPCMDMTNLSELRDRLFYAPSGQAGGSILLVGDSVLGASALLEHRIPRARALTLSTLLRDGLRYKGFASLSLGADGLLLPDIAALAVEWTRQPPQQVVLLLNFRMFAKDFQEGPKALSRPFLAENLPPEILERISPEKGTTQETRLSDRLYAWLCDHWFLFKETQMAKNFWYYPSQKDFFQRILEKILGRNETQVEIAEAALKQKIGDYYQPYDWNRSGLSFACLEKVLALCVRAHIPIQVFLTPQNPSFLGDLLDRPSFDRNRRALALFMEPYRRAEVVYHDWSGRYPACFFLDHCHLTPEGNQRYAKDLEKNCGGPE